VVSSAKKGGRGSRDGMVGVAEVAGKGLV